MIRILLPLAVIATLFFAPIYNETVRGSESGERVDTLTGQYYAGPAINCWLKKNFSLGGDCEPKGGLKGTMIFGAIAVSAIAAALGIPGLLPGVSRATSAVTMLAGAVVVAAIMFYLLAQMRAEEGMSAVQWGAYLAGGGGLLTLISGLSGMRGR